MSLYAILTATRSKLLTDLKFADNEVGITYGGRPAATMGQKFVGIHSTDWSPDEVDMNRALSEVFSIAITVTIRLGTYPADLNEGLLVDPKLSLDTIIRRCILSIHQNYDLLNSANELLGNATDKFVEPFRWLGGDAEPRVVDSSWFETTDIESQENSVLVMTQNFGRAKRIQAIFDTNRIVN